MKQLILSFAALLAAISAFAQEFVYTEATDLTITGKVFPDTPEPYQRMDFEKYGRLKFSANLISNISQ